MEVAFWVSISLVLYNLIGFPVIIVLLSFILSRPVKKNADYLPPLTVLITAHNEEKSIRAKLENTLAFDYPAEKLEILLALDGCTDATANIAREFGERVRVLDYPERRGKTPVQNDAAKEATGEVIYFTDATAMHNPGAPRAIVANCADASVGCVTGLVEFSATRKRGSEGVSARLGYEHYIRDRAGRLFSMLGASGCNYGMPKRYVRHVGGGLTHDYAAPLLALLEGKRTVFEPEALAIVERPLGGRDEFKRRARIATQGLTAVFGIPAALNPIRHPFLSLTIISMRLLKWHIPVFLIVALVSNVFLLGSLFYDVTMGLQLLVAALALVGAVWRRSGTPPAVVSIAFYFYLLNLSALRGIWDFLRRERYVVWEATSR